MESVAGNNEQCNCINGHSLERQCEFLTTMNGVRQNEQDGSSVKMASARAAHRQTGQNLLYKL